MAKPQFYKPAPKWQIFAALGGALFIEFAAIGVASLHRKEVIPPEPQLIQQAVDVALVPEDPQPTPPPEQDEPPPPPPPPDQPPEFTIEEPTPPPRPANAPTPKPRLRVAATRPAGPAVPRGPVAFVNAKANMQSMPHPAYPYEAQKRHATGSGSFAVHFDPATGEATSVDVIQSTGFPILDETTVNTFRRWRAKPGAGLTKVTVPITYTLQGAQL